MTTISNPSAAIFDQLGLSRTTEARSDNELAQSDFLKLMTAQLQNQDPFSPMENTEFLSQMAQFGTVAGVEKLNSGFDSLAATLNGNRALQASMIVGSQVLVASDTNLLGADGGFAGAVDLPARVGSLQVRIEDGVGQTLAVLPLGEQPKGLVGFEWNGQTSSGAQVPPGRYRMIAEASIDGQVERLPTLAAANVDSVTLGRGSGEFTLSLAGLGEVGLDQVRQIKQ